LQCSLKAGEEDTKTTNHKKTKYNKETKDNNKEANDHDKESKDDEKVNDKEAEDNKGTKGIKEETKGSKEVKRQEAKKGAAARINMGLMGPSVKAMHWRVPKF